LEWNLELFALEWNLWCWLVYTFVFCDIVMKVNVLHNSTYSVLPICDKLLDIASPTKYWYGLNKSKKETIKADIASKYLWLNGECPVAKQNRPSTLHELHEIWCACIDPTVMSGVIDPTLKWPGPLEIWLRIPRVNFRRWPLEYHFLEKCHCRLQEKCGFVEMLMLFGLF
jgi:hypothetical protein